MKRIFLSAAATMIIIGLGCAGADLSKAPIPDGKTGKVPSGEVKEEPALVEDSARSVKGAPPAERKKKDGDRDLSSAAGKKADGRGETEKAALGYDDSPREAAGRGPAAPASSGLKAGYADDNKQFGYFVNFLDKFGPQVQHVPINVNERIILRVKDKNGKSIANADVSVYADNKQLCEGKTYADGSFLFFPSEYDKKHKKYRAVVSYGQKTREVNLDRQGVREVGVAFDTARAEYKNVPLDIVFIMDTTGSMGEEINRLKNTIEIINLNLAALSTKPRIRFGMVLYKDRGDEYVTKVVQLTEDLDRFRADLEKVSAGGGGDEPEDLQAALMDTVNKMKWGKEGIRLCFIITDAPPQLYGDQKYKYDDAVRDARKNAIKIFSVGTGGLNLMGEYILRQISQYTYAKYIFLTYGERGESEGGGEGSVSHHTGANFQTDKLETIIIRFAKEELGHLSDQPLKEGDEYFQAIKIQDEKNEETLQKLFDMSVAQLIDYSTLSIPSGTPASLIPFSPGTPVLKLNAEYFSEQMVFSINKNKTFKMVERKDIQKILKELAIQQTGLVDDGNAAKVGKMLGARMIISGVLYSKADAYEIFLKLLRVETGEVLSVNKLKIDKRLGLSK